jgi:hypothetical protein
LEGLPLVRFAKGLRCFPYSVLNFVSFWCVDNNRETTVVSNLERSAWHKSLYLCGPFWGSHHGAHNSIRPGHFVISITPALEWSGFYGTSKAHLIDAISEHDLACNDLNDEGIFFPSLFVGKHDYKTLHILFCGRKRLQLGMLCSGDRDTARQAAHEQDCLQHKQCTMPHDRSPLF